MAEFEFGLELWEHVVQARDRNVVRRMCSSLEDGLGEASEDLRPGSEFLRTLNARPRNPNVKYSLLLGNAGMVPAAVLGRTRKALADAGRRSRFVMLLGPKVDDLLGDLDEVVIGKGDGAVALKRGRLEGVEDTVVLSFTHLQMLGRAGWSGSEVLNRAVYERLGIEPPDAEEPEAPPIDP